MSNNGYEPPKGIFISERGTISIHKNVLSVLNRPSYLFFWWSDRERTLFLSAANEKAPASIAIPDNCIRNKNGVRFINRELLRSILTLTGWEDKTTHRLSGEYVPELDMVAFKISDAV